MMTLAAYLDAIASTEREYRSIVDGVSDRQWLWMPDTGGWGLAECLDHIAKANLVYLDAIDAAVDGAKQSDRPSNDEIRPGWFSRSFIWSIAPPPRMKLKARKVIEPPPARPRADVLADYLRSHERIRALVERGKQVDLNRVRFVNPILAIFRFTAGTGLLVLEAHERRHLWQAARIRDADGFPTA